MATRQSMVHRAAVQRDTNGSNDDWGQPEPPNWTTHIAALPCFYFTQSRAETRDQITTVVAVNRLFIPKTADVSERDRILDIRDRAGNVIEAGPFNIRTVEYKKDHDECTLQEVE